MHNIKVIVEQHEDGFVAYPIGMKGVVVGQGETVDEVLSDVRSAIQFHMETFGADAFNKDVGEVLLANVTVPA
ncbi:MAG: type II toxin-antitoxin system HicB family antitoxin [Verrucomicrobia bacterium]|nr:type II toxin-antitoxin system HicB family antitoxin [Verrucomicrobiota bacterium]